MQPKKHYKILIVTNTLKPSAISKIVFFRVISDFKQNNVCFLVKCSVGDKQENKQWFDFYYKKQGSRVKIKFILWDSWIFTAIKRLSYRFYKTIHSYYSNLIFFWECFMNYFREVLIYNVDFTRQVPRIYSLKKIYIFHEIHSMTLDMTTFKNYDNLFFIFLNKLQSDSYCKNYPRVLQNTGENKNIMIIPYPFLKFSSFRGMLSLECVNVSHDIKSILSLVKINKQRHKLNIVYFGRLIEGKGIVELINVVKTMETGKIGLFIFGQRNDWFNSSVSDKNNQIDNVYIFDQLFCNVEEILELFNFSILLSESEVRPLSILESDSVGLTTVCLKRQYLENEDLLSRKIVVLNAIEDIYSFLENKSIEN